MPLPVLDPIPLPSLEFRLDPPEDAQDASYFAASARIANLSMTGSGFAGMFCLLCSLWRPPVRQRSPRVANQRPESNVIIGPLILRTGRRCRHWLRRHRC